jgi:hypothetical protein
MRIKPASPANAGEVDRQDTSAKRIVNQNLIGSSLTLIVPKPLAKAIQKCRMSCLPSGTCSLGRG